LKKKLLLVPALLLACLLTFGGGLSVNAAEPDFSKPYDVSITFNKDTATEKNFAWLTKNLGVGQAVVVVQEVGGGPQKVFTGSQEIVSGRQNYYIDPVFFNNPGNIAPFKVSKVTVTGLKPDTRYEYYCGDGTPENRSEKSYFVTGVAAGSFTFLFMSDPQSASDSQFELWKRCSERAYATFPDSKFVMLAGDLVDKGSSEIQWDKFFTYGGNVLSRLTVAAAIGNHEADYGHNTFSKHFNFPGNGRGLPDYVYSFDMGNARFLVLSTEKTIAELTSSDENVRKQANQFLDSQIEWLKSEVLNNPKKWNIVMFHKGIYSGGRYANTNETLSYRNKFAPVFDELSIDVVLQGHNHTFDRAFLYGGKTAGGINAFSQSAVKGSGTLYLTVNTAGPKFYEESAVAPVYLLKHSQPRTQLYAGITVSENYIKFDTYAVISPGSDTLFDTFTLYKL